MRLALIVATLLLTACSVEGWQIRTAQEVCKDHGGVDSMTQFMLTTVTCMDGKKFVPARSR